MPTENTTEAAFRLEELDGGIALVTFDQPEKKVNTFSRPVLDELDRLVGELENRSDLRGLLFQSGKPAQFIAGADLNELGALAHASPEQIEETLQTGHALFTRISRLPFPTVALIDGNCMGGGTELVLAMDERLASDSPKTRIALPEVNIGLFPAWGGTTRLPRLIGVHHAIEMVTSGNPVDGKRAAEVGLAFDAVPAEQLVEEGRRLIEMLHEEGGWQAKRERREQPVGLTEDEKNFAFAVAEGQIRGQTKGQYPAPLVALRVMRDGINRPVEEALQLEREAAPEVFGTPTAGNLIHLFFVENKLARDPGVDDPAVTPRGVQRVGVVGLGLMGAGIAAAHARSRIATCATETDEERIEAGLGRARHVVESRIRIGRATQKDLADMLAHLNTSTDYDIFSDCDVVVEAVPEKEELKTSVYRQLAGHLRDDAILASNTSTISITRMAEAAPHPERFAGMHFFYPVDRMKLVEIVRGEQTSDETIATLVALSKRIRKTPIVVNDCPGFLINRVLLPYMNESVLMLLEGAEMDRIDKASVEFGFPMGPIALHDLVGLDTAYAAGKVLADAFSERSVQPGLLQDLVEAGRLGKKSGAGFRRFTGKKGRPESDPDFASFLEKHRTGEREIGEDEIRDRLLLPMLLEATRCVEDGIVREPAHADMGLILGIGFPAFRGGLLRWCDSEGADAILKRLEPYRELGQRFEPTESLIRMAQSDERFYPSA